MDITTLKKRLTLKEVSVKHTKQFNDLLTYVFQFTTEDIQKGGYKDETTLIQSKKPILECSKVLGWFDDDLLISQVVIYPCEVNIHGIKYKMGGVTGVGTYPEYAGYGLMRDLFYSALVQMRAAGQWISYLFPYNIPYYRRKGWEIISNKLTFTIPDSQLPKPRPTRGLVERKDVYDSDVFLTYDKFSKKNHGAMIRNSFLWDEYWRYEDEEEHTAAIFYDENEVAQGVLIYWIAEEVLHIKEMYYLTQDARRGLWNFISAHLSMVERVKGSTYKNEPLSFLLEDGGIKEVIEPYYMARIIDVEKFLEAFPFTIRPNSKPFHFIVSDPLAEWNNRVYGITWDAQKKVIITAKEVGEAVILDIQTLTCLLMNYRRASYLARIERLNANEETINMLENIIPNNDMYFSDYF